MQVYLDLLQHIRDHGKLKDDRTGIGTLSTFGYQMRFDVFRNVLRESTIRTVVYHDVVQGLKTDPNSRRHIVSAWNVGEIEQMALAPCHTMFQFYVADNRLSCQLYQRSADVFLGVPFNIASYALLTLMIAQVCGYSPGEFIHTLGDTHLYVNHLKQADEQLTRTPLTAPTMHLNPAVDSIYDFTFDDFELKGYEALPSITAPIAV